MNPRNQSFMVTFLLIVAVAAMVFMMVQRDAGTSQTLTINQLAQDIKLEKVSRVVINTDDSLRVIYASGSEEGIQSYKETNSTLVE
ncbi:MAG TPA: cell division protein FtsH, partial [Anaerolineales bacterium]|nr:cell division protein FtsH [Anaerolineales bacterium]